MLRSLLFQSGKGLVLAALTVLFAAGTVLAQTGRIEGTVRSSQTGDPIQGARVTVIGTGLASTTNENGYYAIADLPVGTYRLRARVIGYQSMTVTNQLVAAGLPTAVNFSLNSSILRIEGVVVTGVVQETQAVKLPFTVDQILAEELAEVPAANAEDALRGKVAGAKVIRGSAVPGSGTSVVLRGATSIDIVGRTQEPLYIVDGAILAASMVDIDALDIDNIEVVKGAAAASLYGARAANGVVQIRTKRGRNLPLGETRIVLRTEFTKNDLIRKVPTSGAHEFCTLGTDWTDCAGTVVTRSTRVADTTVYPLCPSAPDPLCEFQVNDFPGATFDQLDRFFDPGSAMINTISIAHRTAGTNFRASFSNTREDGILPHQEGYRRRGVRLNMDHSLGRTFDFSASGFYSQSTNDAFETNGFFGLQFMAPDVDLLKLATDPRDSVDYIIKPDPNSLEDNPIYELANRTIEDKRSRVLGSFRGIWRPVDFIDIEGDFSFDRSDRNSFDFRDLGFKTVGGGFEDGRISLSNSLDQAVNVSVTAAARWSYGDLHGTSRVRVLAERVNEDFFSAAGRDLQVGVLPDLDNVGVDEETIVSSRIEIKSLGYFFITGLDYADKYIADFMVRRDGSSLFGEDERWHTYYRVSGAYRVAQEEWWPFGIFDEFKLRASLGTAGGRPSFPGQYETFNVSGGAISKLQLGNKALKPEFVKEFEAGVDLVAAGRVALSVTYAKSVAEDQILAVPLAAAAGFTTQWQNAGTLESKTWEASLQASLIQTADLSWNWSVVWDRTRQRITQFDVPPFRWGLATRSSIERMKNTAAFMASSGSRRAQRCCSLPLMRPRALPTSR